MTDSRQTKHQCNHVDSPAPPASSIQAPKHPAQVKPFVPLLPYQKQDVQSDARFRWSCWSRQSGKSFTKSLRRILRGLQRRRNQIFLSAGERQSRELMQKAAQHCRTLQLAAQSLRSRYFNDTSFKQLEIELPNGVRIIGLPANPQTIRGFTGDVFLDEFAMHADDRAIWASIFPTLLRGDGELDIASTPKGKSNLFYELSKNDRFERNTVTLSDAIDQGLHADFDDMRSSMNDDHLFRQEFLCEFLDESTAFLTYEQIAACEDQTLEKTPTIDELALATGHLFVGIDIGRKRDLTVIWVFERAVDSQTTGLDPSSRLHPSHLITRAVYERQGQPFREQYEFIGEILSLRNVRNCCIDSGGIGMQLAESAVEDFGAHRVQPVIFTNTVKDELAHKLRIAVESRFIRIPVDAQLRNDWHSLQRGLTASGQTRFDAARSNTGHADRFWAAALAVRAAGKIDGAAVCLNAKPLAFAGQGAW